MGEEYLKSIERLKRLMNGEKLKCPRCRDGYISAVGDLQSTNVFKCDCCETAIVPRIGKSIFRQEQEDSD